MSRSWSKSAFRRGSLEPVVLWVARSCSCSPGAVWGVSSIIAAVWAVVFLIVVVNEYDVLGQQSCNPNCRSRLCNVDNCHTPMLTKITDGAIPLMESALICGRKKSSAGQTTAINAWSWWQVFKWTRLLYLLNLMLVGSPSRLLRHSSVQNTVDAIARHFFK